MPFVPAKCTNCGANLNVDQSKEAGICPHCGQPYIMEKAINNYNTTNVTNIDAINADVVNIESSDSVDNLARTAETFVKFSEWDKAREIYIEISRKYPFDWRGWYGLLQTNTHNFQLVFETIEEYDALVVLYEKMLAVSDNTLLSVREITEYVKIIHEKVTLASTVTYEHEQQWLNIAIETANAKIKNNVPLEIKNVKTFNAKLTKVVYICWLIIAALFSIVIGISNTMSDCGLNLEFGFIRFANMDSFWDITLFISVFALMLQLILSFVLFLFGWSELFLQICSKQKRATAFKFITKLSIIVISAHLIYCFITIFMVGISDPGYFFSYSGAYRYIETVLFHSKATQTEACWIALLLIVIYSVINYMLVATPLFISERIGNKRERVILQEIQNRREIEQLVEKKDLSTNRYKEERSKLEMLKNKYINKV